MWVVRIPLFAATASRSIASKRAIEWMLFVVWRYVVGAQRMRRLPTERRPSGAFEFEDEQEEKGVLLIPDSETKKVSREKPLCP